MPEYERQLRAKVFQKSDSKQKKIDEAAAKRA